SMISLDAAAQVMREEMRRTVKRYSLWYLVQGGLMILAGILALVYPAISSVAVVFFIGWLLIFSGIFQGISLIGARQVPHFWLQLISVALFIVVGAPFSPQSGRELTHSHATADRVLLDRRDFKGNFCADDTAVPELGLGPG